MTITRLQVGLIGTNCYIIRPDDGKTYVIDPGDAAQRIEDAAPNPDFFLLTHAHWDHLLALEELHKRFPQAAICVHPEAMYNTDDIVGLMQAIDPALARHCASRVGNLPPADVRPRDGETVGPFEVIHTPGHEPGCVCYYLRDENVLFSGDTLFADCCGRTDLKGSSPAQMRKSLLKLQTIIRPDTRILPGHGAEGKASFALESSLAMC